jgi:hypothetical protein
VDHCGLHANNPLILAAIAIKAVNAAFWLAVKVARRYHD